MAILDFSVVKLIEFYVNTFTYKNFFLSQELKDIHLFLFVCFKIALFIFPPRTDFCMCSDKGIKFIFLFPYG